MVRQACGPLPLLNRVLSVNSNPGRDDQGGLEALDSQHGKKCGIVTAMLLTKGYQT
jgi:hypothetical protein